MPSPKDRLAALCLYQPSDLLKKEAPLWMVHTNMQAKLIKPPYHFPSVLVLSSATTHPLCIFPLVYSIPHSPTTAHGPSTHQDQFGCHSLHIGNSAWLQPPSSCPETEDNMHESSPNGTWHQRMGTGTGVDRRWPHALPLQCGQQIQGEKPCCALVHTKGADHWHWLHLIASAAGSDQRGFIRLRTGKS